MFVCLSNSQSDSLLSSFPFILYLFLSLTVFLFIPSSLFVLYILSSPHLSFYFSFKFSFSISILTFSAFSCSPNSSLHYSFLFLYFSPFFLSLFYSCLFLFIGFNTLYSFFSISLFHPLSLSLSACTISSSSLSHTACSVFHHAGSLLLIKPLTEFLIELRHSYLK